MGFRPIHNNVLVKLPAKPTENRQTAGGIYLPDSSKQERPMSGKVMAVGAGKLTPKGQVVPAAFKPGDIVVFEQYSGTELLLDDERHLLIPENKLVGLLSDD
jgi:chaperonin GroES